jgi:predicted Zn-dependent protease
VFVLTGLLDRVGDDDDMLRGVLAHELGHAVLRHGMRSIVRSGIYALLLGILVGGLDDVSGYIVSQAGELDKLSHSRDMEEAADGFAVDLLARTGHDAEGLAKFLESLGSQPVPELLSTHPDSEDRAKEIRKRSKRKK